MIGTRPRSATRFAIHPVIALLNIADAIPEVVDAAKIRAEVRGRAVNVSATLEVVTPGIAIDRLILTGWGRRIRGGRLWLRRIGWRRFGGMSGCGCDSWGCGSRRGWFGGGCWLMGLGGGSRRMRVILRDLA
jgi:hypothetical protein